VIVMELAGDPLGSEEATSGHRPVELPFIAMQRYLRAGGLAVPEVHAYLEQDGLLLLEDLGPRTLEDVVKGLDADARRPYYQRAIDDLLAFQRYTKTSADCLCFERAFDPELLRWELDHFVEWLLVAERGQTLDADEARVVDSAFERITAALCALPQIVVHRDYQSRNLMVQSATDATDFRLRLIDFQDALLGPAPYDLVALLRDSYVDLGLDLVDELLKSYIDAAQPEIGEAAFIEAFWLQALQRKLKDAGRFVYIDRVKGNASFLGFIPLSLRYIGQAFDRLPGYRELREVLAHHVPELSSPNAS